MKILGEDKDNLIVMMSKDEAANYTGEYSAYHMREKLIPGARLDMGTVYKEAREAIAAFDAAGGRAISFRGRMLEAPVMQRYRRIAAAKKSIEILL